MPRCNGPSGVKILCMLVLQYTVHYTIYVAKKTGCVFKGMLQAITMWRAESVNDNENNIAISLYTRNSRTLHAMKSVWIVHTVQWLVAGRRRNWRSLPPDRNRYFVSGAQLRYTDLFPDGKSAETWNWTSHSISCDVKIKWNYNSTFVYGIKTNFFTKYQIYRYTRVLRY